MRRTRVRLAKTLFILYINTIIIRVRYNNNAGRAMGNDAHHVDRRAFRDPSACVFFHPVDNVSSPARDRNRINDFFFNKRASTGILSKRADSRSI